MPAELDQMNPGMGAEPTDTPAPEMGSEVVGLHNGEQDREGAMAKADLYKLANYSHKLFQQIQDDDQLEGWVQAKITKAADYIASVYHYLEYEMKFSEYGHHLDNSDTLSEGQKMRLKEMLSEAKDKMKDLKKSQAEKMKGKHEHKVEEGVLTGGHEKCTECDGTGMIYREAQPVPAHVQSKVDKYKTLVKATKAAHKRLDANHNGIPDDEESVDEEFTDKSKVGDTFKTRTGVATKTDTGMKHSNTSYHDDGEAEEKSGKGIKTHAKAKDSETKKAERGNDIKLPKHDKPTYGMKNGEKFDNRPKEKDVDESLGLGVYEAKKKKGDGNLANNAKPYDKVTRGDVIAGRLGKDEKGGKAVKEAAPRGQKSQDSVMKIHQIGKSKSPGANLKQSAEDALEKDNHKKIDQIHQYATTTTPTGRAKKVSEAKPSAGLSAAKKSAVVKDAKAGKDIGKPGKGFDKVAKKAGGGEKGEKIAAAAMWKNMKETVAYMSEKKAAVKDLPGKQEKIDADHDGKIEKSDLAALRAGKKETVKESTEFNRMKELMQRLNG
jgi:hypothetical protein